MKLTEMRPQPENNTTTLSSANFFNWKEAGSLGVPIRPFGDFVRRYLHFVTVTKADGQQVFRPISCIDFDYNSPEVIPQKNDCPLDEVYELQLEGKVHSDLPFCSFAEPPASWGKDAKIQKYSFSASVNAINRAKQNGTTDLECIEIVSFKQSAWNRVLLIAGVDGNSAFSAGDPTDPDTGFDLLCMYHADRPGIQRYELQAGRQASPLSDEEKAVIQETVNLDEYYKVLTRDEIIETLTNIYEGDSGSSSSTSSSGTGDVAGMMKQADSSLAGSFS